MVGQHTWELDECDHAELDEEARDKVYLEAYSPAHLALIEVGSSLYLQKTIPYVVNFRYVASFLGCFVEILSFNSGSFPMTVTKSRSKYSRLTMSFQGH